PKWRGARVNGFHHAAGSPSSLRHQKSVDEAKKIRDASEALHAYAEQAKNKQLEVDAAEIRIRAERQVGELIPLQKATGGFATGGDAQRTRYRKGTESPPTLAEGRIDKKLSSRPTLVFRLLYASRGRAARLQDGCKLNRRIGRDGRIRTGDPLTPSQVRYPG